MRVAGSLPYGPRIGISSTAMGRVGELRAAAHLLERGHSVSEPLADDRGVDLIVDGRLTVQVKTSGSRQQPVVRGRVYDGLYAFGLKGGIRADVLVAYALPEDAWWVIPREVLGQGSVTTLALAVAPRRASSRARRLLAFRDAWHVFDEGFVLPQLSFADSGGCDGGRGLEEGVCG